MPYFLTPPLCQPNFHFSQVCIFYFCDLLWNCEAARRNIYATVFHVFKSSDQTLLKLLNVLQKYLKLLLG
ncbi:hypothetical protein GLYMA_13G071200v4 [Glycine max]|uniref:Uncharacterized protein n=1 Tax=Glycine max TaxID=3847 RepID=K7LXB3_SOYBN|nr:hypothetical protein JHK85_036261 [Glycine max]KAH1100229.1 hypothetical protein GYH30_035405 [Glycine max]KRH18611.1 hypothetical protein GLYMA_13G071200v4 [Glycine max]